MTHYIRMAETDYGGKLAIRTNFVIEEMADGFIAIGGTVSVDDIRESVTMAVENPAGIGIPEHFGKIAIGTFPISFEDE